MTTNHDLIARARAALGLEREEPMTTDHELIARACRLVPGITCWEGDDGQLHCMVEEHYHPDCANSPALHALLVQRLQMQTGACIDYFIEDEEWLVIERGGCAYIHFFGELKTPIDIIRVLVDALEEGE